MKLIQLEYFCAVSRCQSITQAASELYVTQPAISAAIRELEKEFSVNLFVRSKNRLSLTKEGEIFYQKAKDLLQYAQQTSQQLYDLSGIALPVKIGIPPLLSTIFFPEMILEFQQKYPQIPTELFEYGSIRAASLVQEDALDLALANMNFSDIGKVGSFRFFTDQLVFCVSPEHSLAGRKELTLSELKNEPIIMYNVDSVQNQTLSSLFEEQGIKPNIILQASQLYTIHKFIIHRLGGAILYSSLLEQLTDLVGIPLSPPIKQDIGIIWKKRKYLNNSVEQFISFAKKYAARHMPENLL